MRSFACGLGLRVGSVRVAGLGLREGWGVENHATSWLW